MDAPFFLSRRANCGACATPLRSGQVNIGGLKYGRSLSSSEDLDEG